MVEQKPKLSAFTRSLSLHCSLSNHGQSRGSLTVKEIVPARILFHESMGHRNVQSNDQNNGSDYLRQISTTEREGACQVLFPMSNAVSPVCHKKKTMALPYKC